MLYALKKLWQIVADACDVFQGERRIGETGVEPHHQRRPGADYRIRFTGLRFQRNLITAATRQVDEGDAGQALCREYGHGIHLDGCAALDGKR